MDKFDIDNYVRWRSDVVFLGMWKDNPINIYEIYRPYEMPEPYLTLNELFDIRKELR